MRNEQKAPVAMFERYFAGEYGKKRAWSLEGRGSTRNGLLAFRPNATTEIGLAWDKKSSEVEALYYEKSEKEENSFWTDGSIFYRFFQQLDCSSIVELACGHGRHVKHYLSEANAATS